MQSWQAVTVTLAKTLTPLVSLGISLMAASGASAFSVTSVGSFSNPVGGSSIEFKTVGNERVVSWGTPAAPATAQSSLGFLGTSNSADFGDVINLGRLRHFNSATFGDFLQSVDLTINLGFGGIPVAPQNFLYTLEIDETTNDGNCVYPGVTICPDRIAFSNSLPDRTFTVDGVAYTLQLLGFRKTAVSPLLGEFISEEGVSNEAFLFGRVVRADAVPEPTTMAGLALAGMGLAIARRRQRR